MTHGLELGTDLESGRGMRAIWTGEIAFGLVTIPVKLYSATKDLAPHFHYIHKKCGTRIETVRRCAHCDVDVPWDQIIKGYEVSKGKYAKFSKEELAEIEEENAASGIDIAEFVDPHQIDLAYVEKSYWVGPTGKSTRGYELLREVLDKSEKVGIARVKIRTRTRVAILRPREGRFALDMMRFGDELVDAGEIEVPSTRKHASAKELELAMSLVKQLTVKEFDPTRHADDYRTAVAAAVDKKVDEDEVAEDGEERRAANHNARGKGAKVVDLADILARSMKATKGHAKPHAAKSHAARSTTKRTAKAKASPRKAAAHPRHRKAS